MSARRVMLLFLAACSSDGAVVADAGGDADSGNDAPPAAPYRIMAPPQIAANTAVRNRVLVIGTQEDGSPALDELVLSFDRPGAGTYSAPVVTLGSLGATSYFSACDLATPGCAGPVKLTAALASAPAVPVAELAVEIVDPVEVNPAKACLGGGNVLYLKGNDSIFNGETTITNATWTFDQAFQEYLVARVTPAGSTGSWSLVFDVRSYAPIHIPDAYENAQLSQIDRERDRPAMHISGFGNGCTSVLGRYDVVDYAVGSNAVQKLTIAFEQFCNGAPSKKLAGCVHYQP